MPSDTPNRVGSASPQEEARHLLATLRRQIEALPASEAAPLLETLTALEATALPADSLAPRQPPPSGADEAMYRSVIAQLSDGLLLTDAQGRVLEWNAALERITGISHTVAVGQPIWDIQSWLAPEEHRTQANRNANQARIHDFLDTGQAPWLDQSVVNTFQRPDGTRGILQARIFLIRLPNTYLLGSVVQDITEQKRTEEALRESEERLRAIFTSAQDAIFMKDRDLVYTHVNPIVEFHNQRPADQIIGKTDVDLFGPEHAAIIREFEQRVLEGEINEGERIVVIQGKSYTFHTIRVPVRDSTGAIIGLCAFARDITDRRRAEKELQESEARYRALVNASTAGIFVIQEERYVFANPAGAHMLNVQDPAEIVGRPVKDVVGPNYREQLMERHETLMTGRTNRPLEIKLTRADGQMMYIESTSIQITLQGKPATLVVSQDITARKETEEALRASQELAQQVLAASPDVITLADLSGRILFASQQAVRTYALDDVEQVIGRPLLDFVAPEEREQAASDLQDLFASEQSMSAQYTLVRADGSRFSAEVNAAVLRGPDNKPNRIVAITHDITERLEAEQHRLALAVEREHISVLTDFLQNASHEFSAPLSVINAELYMLLRSVESPEHLARLNRLQDHAKQVDKLVKAMLTMSRLDNGLPFTFAPTDLNQLVQDTVNRFLSHAESRQIAIHLELDEAWPAVASDAHELHLALSKLLENAIHFTEAEGTITVTTRVTDGRVAVTVKDTGIGISPEDLPHVLERFYRADKARTKRGAGLGLSIAAKIIENHGGDIQIESTPGVGTTVVLTLPTLVNGGVQIV